MGRVLLIDKGEIAGGITGKAGGLIRKFNHPPKTFKLACESFDAYMRFEEEIGASCGFRQIGCTYLFPELQTEEKRQLNILEEISYPIQMRKENGNLLLTEPLAGCIDPKLTCQAWVQAASRYGGKALENLKVEEILLEKRHPIGVRTSEGVISAGCILVAAGAGSIRLLKQLAIHTPLKAKYFQYQLFTNQLGLFSTAMIDKISNLYLIPLDEKGILVGSLLHDRPCYRDSPDRKIDWEQQRFVQETIKSQFPSFKQEKILKVGLAVDAFADQILIGACFGYKGVYIAAGWGGGGIKIAPAVAKEIATLLKEQPA